MKKLNFKRLLGFLKNEVEPKNCAQQLACLIEFSSVLYMISCDGKETHEKVHEYTTFDMADSLADVNSLAKMFLAMKSPDDFSDLEKYLKEVIDPLELAQNLVSFSFGINMLLILISNDEQTALMYNQLSSSEYYDSLRLLTNLADIFSEMDNVIYQDQSVLNVNNQ